VAVTPTYPGVYVEELPSLVRTIAGVRTAVAAFIGYTRRGQTNKARRILNFGDFERAFGGLSTVSPMSYAVHQYFQNGGQEAWVVRVAAGADAAAVELRNASTGAGARPVLVARAASQGLWGNGLRIDVDHDTVNPNDLFNLRVTEYREENGRLVEGPSEAHRNLSMDSASPNYAVDMVNAHSDLVALARAAGATGAITGPGEALSTAHDPDTFDFSAIGPGRNRLTVTVDGDGPHELAITPPAATGAAPARFMSIATNIANDVQARLGLSIDGKVVGSGSTQRLRFRSDLGDEHSMVRFGNAGQANVAGLLGLGVMNGGTEQSASAAMRPSANGTVGDNLDVSLGTGGLNGLDRGAGQPAAITARVRVGGTTAFTDAAVQLLGPDEDPPSSKQRLRQRLEEAFHAAAEVEANAAVSAELAGTRVLLTSNRLTVVPGGSADTWFTLNTAGADNTAAKLGLDGTPRPNVARYALGEGATVRAQSGASLGSDGTEPTVSEFRGNFDRKEGLYALEDVDLFTILSIPEQSDRTLLAEAMTYCEARRAFFIVDLPGTVQTLEDADGWITDAATPKSRNAAAYFPWVLQPDPLQGYRPRPFPPSGMLAGLYARTDATRGVWKAPAGTEATLRGPQGVVYKLTDHENGVINPLGLNAIRSLPVYGFVSWGARTLVGADQMADQWKYIPVRRVALFIEESLYRGTQWVVFEPNDEPLWAQIRLNVGAFMHSLFRKGAFQGASPSDAYLVKCDAETTTQNDIDRGIVNILVGFAPLKPAEFVIIKISQLAGQIET
jgi:uncharacterized protein